MNIRTRRTAETNSIVDKLGMLESDLLNIPYVSKVDFDIDNFDVSERHPQIIFLIKYDIPLELPVEDWFTARRTIIENCDSVATSHELTQSGDRVEDQGTWLYFVRRCGRTWITNPSTERR